MINYISKLHSFTDLYETVKELQPKQKGDLFEELTKYIFQYHPNYRNITKEIWLLNETPLALLKKLNLPTKDQGIDLILRTKQSKYYAIQCKFRMNVDEVISWTELATFYGLAFGIAKGFSGGFYVTNTLDITTNTKTSNKVIPLYGDFFDTLSNDFFDELKSILIPSVKFVPIPLTPRNYQEIMIRETKDYFTKYDRGIIESACGTGKTLTTYWVYQQLRCSLTIIAVPSLFLLSQFYGDWNKQMNLEKKKANYILVGSQADYDKDEYENNGLLITTNPKELINEIKPIIGNPLIIITTYQSSDKLITALKQLKVEPDLCIFDEAHKTVGQTDTQFNLLLDDKNIKIKKRLFVTATPKIYNGNIEDDNMMSMDDEKWYGKKIHTYNTSDAIRNGYLSDYQIVTMYTDNTYIQNMIKQNKYLWYDDKIIDSQYMSTAIMLLNQFQKKDCTHLVTYHNSIAGSKRFKDLLEKLNADYKLDIVILNIDGNHSMKQRTRIFKEFTNSKLAILVSAKVLNEGVNIPIIDSVCFVDPRSSTIDIIQCVGRALRLYSNKKMAKIYVPIILENIENIDEDKIFNNLVRILKCLNETDANIKCYFSAIANGNVFDRKLIRHDMWIDNSKIGVIVDIEKWVNSIDVKVWEKIDRWEYMYNELVNFVKINDKIPTTFAKDKHQQKLGGFCSHLREYKKKGTLSDEKIKRLELIPHWYWGSQEKKVNKTLDESCDDLVKWIEANGRFPAQQAKNEIENRLGSFVSTQRQKKKKGKLDEKSIKKLESIDGWLWEPKDLFVISYDELMEWVKINKKIPKSTSDNPLI